MFVNDYCKKFLSFQRSINGRADALSVPWSSKNPPFTLVVDGITVYYFYPRETKMNSFIRVWHTAKQKIVIKRADRTNRSRDQM